MLHAFQWINEKVHRSFIGRFFDFENRDTSFTRELQGATATFLSMAYILAVNPRILADSGGTCEPGTEEEGGLWAPKFLECIEEFKRQYVTGTAIAALFGCFAMGLLGNLPIALAPGMGINAYFTYTVVGWRGTGPVSFKAAVTAILIEGGIFFVLAVTGARFFVIKLIPEPVRYATPAAIGCFLAHIGLQTAEGIGAVVGDIATLVTLGACPEDKRTPLVALTEECKANYTTCVISDSYTCDIKGGKMTSATTWLGIVGLLMIAAMLSYKKRAAFLAGIAFVTIISWFRGTLVTYFPYNEAGDARFDYFSQVVSVEPVNLLTANFTNKLSEVGLALFTFLYVDFLDTSGTLLGLITQMGLTDAEGNFPRSRLAFTADALATMFGSLFSISPVTAYIESAAGVSAGARTGLSSCLCGIYFFIAIFFAPLIASIPPWATGGALVVCGALMTSSLTKVKWNNVAHAVTAFNTLVAMTLTYSIAYGILAGYGTWLALQLVFCTLSLVGIRNPTCAEAMLEDESVCVISAPKAKEPIAQATAKEKDDSTLVAAVEEGDMVEVNIGQ